jgi:hypothetical protein
MGLVKRLVLCYAQNQNLFKEDRGRIAWLGPAATTSDRKKPARQQWKELRIGVVALIGLRHWLMSSSTFKRMPLNPTN